MSNESLKNILLNAKPGDYDKIMNHTITEEDIVDFSNLYYEFASLKNEYQLMTFGRKKVAKKLVEKLKFLEQMSNLIDRGIKAQRRHYEDSTRNLERSNVDDYYKALEVLQQLASNDKVQYEINTITYPTFDSSDRHGYRTTEEYTGEIFILAEKKTLFKLDFSKKLPILRQEMLVDIYNQGTSMVLVGNDEYMIERLNIPNKQTLGYYRPLVFYLQDDELATAVESFKKFIEENGADLNQIKTEDIVQAIKSKYQRRSKTKKLI